ncbi:MAG TPA: MOSC domain-containing protein [Microthrixaceae bacterium]|nr:MOSC domain-containing protein [Microthrixaceae bacterium]HMT23846.1 MOSC domain-containing protein [Microthrixaceae bacterium]
MAGVVREIWRYPAKSMLGDRVERAELLGHGMVGDRMWAVRDGVRGGIRGAKKISGLMRLSARYLVEPDGSLPPPPIEIRLPDGTVTGSQQSDVDARLSDALGHPVALEALRPAADVEHFRRGRPDSDDLLAELRGIFGREDDEPLPDMAGMPETIFEHESPPGTYYDVFPIHLITTSSLAHLAALAPESNIDVRRFRPSVVIDTGDDPNDGWVEQTWIGRSLRVGTAELAVVMACPRCVMPTRAVGELAEDRSVLRRIVRDANQNFGVYATVVRPGTIAVGQTVRLGDGRATE